MQQRGGAHITRGRCRSRSALSCTVLHSEHMVVSPTRGVGQDGIAGLPNVRPRCHPLLEGHVGAGALRRLQVRREGDEQAVALQIGAAALKGRVPRLELRPASAHDIVCHWSSRSVAMLSLALTQQKRYKLRTG